MKKGSDDSLKASVRWGCNPKARQMRLTVLWLRPDRWAMDRVLQWVASLGTVSNVSVNHPFHISIGNCSGPTAAGLVRQPVQSLFQEPRTPLVHRCIRYS